MRDLEELVANWRAQMVAGGIKSPQVLDELESHLRDDLEAQVRAGFTATRAFEIAVQRLGQAASLECEFEKVGESSKATERAKSMMLTIAGIPNQYLNGPMNTPTANIEPRWATYLKATAFLAPALFLWAVSSIFIVPKLQQICLDAGLPNSRDTFFWNVTHSNILATNFFREYGVFVSLAILALLAVLEWRSEKWPRYRRAAVGSGTFLLNFVVLVSIFLMVLAAIMVAPALMHRG